MDSAPETNVPAAPPEADRASPTALVLGGGGARGAYQTGVIRAIAHRHPTLQLPIITGVSAGAINAAFLAANAHDFVHAAEQLVDLWLSLTPEKVYRVDASSLLHNVLRWAWRLMSGGIGEAGELTRGLIDTAPLLELLRRALPPDEHGAIAGIEANIARGSLRAVALSATNYANGQSITWVEGTGIHEWERPQRRSELARLGVDHIMASAALPLLFPAVKVGDDWYGDGGIRQTAPLSPALHLGARRILTISTHHARSSSEAETPQIAGYPPPAQILGVLYQAVFLDVIDQDILRLELANKVLAEVPEPQRNGMRHVDILVIRPSCDLGKMSRGYEPNLPSTFRFLTRGLGTRRTTTPDILSLVMFQRDYLQALVDLGESDAAARMPEIDAFLAGEPRAPR